MTAISNTLYLRTLMLNLYQVHIFTVAVEEGSISRAAEKLFLTQPAVSQHLKALETELGAKLLRRGRRGVAPNEAGEIFLSYARCLLRLTEEARQTIALAGHFKGGQVKLGASPGIGMYLLPGWVQSFNQQHAEVSVSMKTATTPLIIKELNKQEIDIGIVEGDVKDNSISGAPLWDEEIIIAVGPGHALWGQKKVKPQSLANERVVIRETGSLTRVWEERISREYGISPLVAAEFDSPAAIKQAVVSGLGIALLPYFAIQPEAQAGMLHPLRLTTGPLTRTMKLLWTPNSLKKSGVRAFIAHLSREFPHLPLQISLNAQDLQILSAGAGQRLPADSMVAPLMENCPQ